MSGPDRIPRVLRRIEQKAQSALAQYLADDVAGALKTVAEIEEVRQAAEEMLDLAKYAETLDQEGTDGNT